MSDAAVLEAPAGKASDLFVLEDWESPKWRINHLYTVVPKEGGDPVRFQMNGRQEKLFDELWYWNLIPKSRQHGITTFIAIVALDQCLFKNSFRAGIIADKEKVATEIFQYKIRDVYDRLPLALRMSRRSIRHSESQLSLSNGSKLFVDLTMRGGTYQMIHISEFGKICAKDPARAKEIVEGTFPTLKAGQRLTIESTFEGAEGYFAEYCIEAQQALLEGRAESVLDFRLHFFAWHQDPDNWIDPRGISIGEGYREYFSVLEAEHGIILNPGQKAWYVETAKKLKDGMKKEHPSFLEEGMHSSLDGKIYRAEMEFLRANGRICDVPHDPSLPVDTFWDLGASDQTAIWFHQYNGSQHRYIRYYENNLEGYGHYIQEFQRHGYVWGTVYLPHDANQKRQHKDRVTTAADMIRDLVPAGVQVIVGDQVPDRSVGIKIAKDWFAGCWFDRERCQIGIQRLDNYKYLYDERLGKFKPEPLHDINSDGADAFREGAQSWRSGNAGQPTLVRHRRRSKV